MNILSIRHLHWVLWIWLLLSEACGGEDVAKTEKRLVFKKESGPHGESRIQRSFVSTRHYSSSSSSSTAEDQTKPPDDRQSTTLRLRKNDTVDLSRNTVPVLRSTEGGKYRTTALPPRPGSLKLKRTGVTRPRPSDLTTLLAFNALNPGQQRYPSTTQVAESIPPTAWALASLKGPSTRRPGPHQVRPFVSWSTRLNKPTTPSPTTELMESSTALGDTTVASDIVDFTAEGVDSTAISSESSSKSIISSTVIPIQNDTSTHNFSLADKTKTKNNTAVDEVKSPATDKPQDIASYKTEENTISVPPLSSLKNTSLDELIQKKDISSSAHYTSNRESEFSQEIGQESQLKTEMVSHSPESQNKYTTQENVSSTISDSSEKTSSESVVSVSSEVVSSPRNVPSEKPSTNSSVTSNESTSQETSNTSQNDSVTTILEPQNNSSFDEIEVQRLTTTELAPQELRVSDKVPTGNSETDHSSESTVRRSDSVANGTSQEADPSINIINVKKSDEASTSTVISTVNSTVTMHVSPVLTTPGSLNLTNLVEEELRRTGGQFDFAKNLPLTAETTTVSKPTFTPTSSPDVKKSSQQERDKDIINQTINDIKPVIEIKPIPVETSTGTSSTKSNEIRIASENVTADGTKETHGQIPELPETTQSNYIQVHEITKPQNRTVLPHFVPPDEITEKPSPGTTIPMTTMRTTMSTKVPPLYNASTIATIMPTITPDNTLMVNESTSISPTTVTTPPPITTTPLSTTTIVPTTTVGLSSPPSVSSSTLGSTTMKSNEIKEPESDHVPIPEKNMTHFEYELPNVVKNESTPLIIQEQDEIEDEDVLSNHTNTSDHINGDGEEETDDGFPDVLNNSSIPINESNVTKEIHTSTTSTSTPAPTTTKPTTTIPNIDDVIVTQIDEEPPNIDDDTVYDTGVIMSVYIQLIFEASYNEICREKDHLRDAIVRIFKKYAVRTIDKRQVQLVNPSLRECNELRGEIEQRHTPVQLYLTDQQGQYDKTLNDLFLSLARQNQLDFKYPITHIEKVIGPHDLTMETESQPSGTVVAAIIISSIAAVCLFALTILLVIMRKRQSGFNYGQRCTPVSLDDYSLDNISVYNSVRRKALRASKRSYGNPAFDDPDVISNPVNFAGLANMASNKAKTDEEFSNLPTVAVKPDELPPGTESKNRYANVIPLPETRVQLHGSTPEEQFINANYVKGAKGAEKCYIACQAPMQNTIDDFWRMVWDEQCRLIIMLTALSENGVEKCADYLPPSEVLDCHRVFGDLQVTLKKREAREKYVIASLQLKNLETNLWREVTHMWYAGWPPTGVPPEPSSIIAFLIEARSYAKGAPTVVHCSPGTGRTGTVIAIDIAIRDFEAGRSVDIPKTVIQVRRGRAGAVQTKDQYQFIYKVLHLYATKLTGGGLDSI